MNITVQIYRFSRKKPIARALDQFGRVANLLSSGNYRTGLTRAKATLLASTDLSEQEAAADFLLQTGRKRAYAAVNCYRQNQNPELPLRPLPTSQIPPGLLNALAQFPPQSADLPVRLRWANRFEEMCLTKYNRERIGKWGLEEFAWLATHPLVDIIRRPLVAAWLREKFMSAVPSSLHEFMGIIWLNYGHFMEGMPGHANITLSELKRKAKELL